MQSTQPRNGPKTRKEIVFDEDARREYLTGFRKRNLLRKEAKRKHAQERERIENLELRKQHRRELAERAAKNVRDVEGAFGVLPDDSIINTEIANHDEKMQEELEFEDEEQFAVVTVVEDFAADSLRYPDPQQRGREEIIRASVKRSVDGKTLYLPCVEKLIECEFDALPDEPASNLPNS